MKIAYLHGLESSIDPSSSKMIWLKDNFDPVYTPTINYNNKESFTIITAHIKTEARLYYWLFNEWVFCISHWSYPRD